MQIVATEHQVRFTKLHERRAEVIADLHKKLIDLDRVVRLFVGIPFRTSDSDAYNKLNEKEMEFQTFLEENQIYLPLNLVNALANLCDEINKAWTIEFDRRSGKDASEVQKEVTAFLKEIPAARNAVQNEFRKMLGVE